MDEQDEQDVEHLNDIKGAAGIIYGAGADTVSIAFSRTISVAESMETIRHLPNSRYFYWLWYCTQNASTKHRKSWMLWWVPVVSLISATGIPFLTFSVSCMRHCGIVDLLVHWGASLKPFLDCSRWYPAVHLGRYCSRDFTKIWPKVIGIPHRSLEDDVYKGMFIPKGSIVFSNIRYVHVIGL